MNLERTSPQSVTTPRPVEQEDPTISVPSKDAMLPGRKEHGGPVRQNTVSTVLLADVPIVALVIDGKERLCLAQISNTLLEGYSYNEIHNRRVALGITCVQCTPVQLEILRRAGAMPVSSRRCGMITKREAERLVKSFLEDTAPPKLPEDFAFDVHHDCGWGCRGSFVPSRYNSSRAKCIKCSYCSMYFSPNKFIFHYHRTPDAKYNHPDAANFNSWRRHLRLVSEQENMDLVYAWEDVKAMFNGGSRKRMSSFSGRPESHSEKSPSQEAKKPRFNDGVESKPLRSPPMDYSPYPMFPTPTTGTPFPILPSAFPPVSLALPVSGHHQDRSPYTTPLRGALPSVQLSADFNASSRSRPVSNLFCSPFDKIWPKYPSLFFAGGNDLSFSRCNNDRLMPQEQNDLRMIGFKSPKTSPSGTKRENVDFITSSTRSPSGDRVHSLSGSAEQRGWCSAFRLVGNISQQRGLDSTNAQAMKTKQTMSLETVHEDDRVSPKSDSQFGDKGSDHGDEGICADEDSDEEISVKDDEIDIEDRELDGHIDGAGSPRDLGDGDLSPDDKPVTSVDRTVVDKSPDTHSEDTANISHRRETADSTSGSTDFSALSREQLQSELQQEMEARKKVEKECSTIKETFEDQIKRAMEYREQLQAVRETLCSKLDQERKVRLSLQEQLKEAHDALRSFTCNMLASRHCTDCPVKDIMQPR